MKAKRVDAAEDTRDVQLVLSNDEAKSLLAAANRVGGDPRSTRRGDFDTLASTLRRLGVEDVEDTVSGSIYFSKRKNED